MKAKGQRVDTVFHLQAPVEVLESRILGRRVHVPSGRMYHIDSKVPKDAGLDDVTGEPLVRRPDDTKEVLDQRLRRYRDHGNEVLNFYEKNGDMVVKVNGNQDQHIVGLEIRSILERTRAPPKMSTPEKESGK
eukprot:GHVU01222496.1.p1 GENE.GHVU01222496.1~~GHVU01222496.1.p1  ORF type:complete len:133 (-),score=30.05 GHVU01222496.1:228-626(-)